MYPASSHVFSACFRVSPMRKRTRIQSLKLYFFVMNFKFPSYEYFTIGERPKAWDPRKSANQNAENHHFKHSNNHDSLLHVLLLVLLLELDTVSNILYCIL